MTPETTGAIKLSMITISAREDNVIASLLIINKTPGNNDTESEQNGDFSQSDSGSEYKPNAKQAKNYTKLFKSRNVSNSSSSDKDSSSSFSSSSSSSSSSSFSSRSRFLEPNTTVDLQNNEGNSEPEPTPHPAVNLEQESNKRSRKRQKNMNEWKQVISKRLKNNGQEYTTQRG